MGVNLEKCFNAIESLHVRREKMNVNRKIALLAVTAVAVIGSVLAAGLTFTAATNAGSEGMTVYKSIVGLISWFSALAFPWTPAKAEAARFVSMMTRTTITRILDRWSSSRSASI